MSPRKVENTKILSNLSSQTKDEFSVCDAAAILELASLLGIKTETVIFVILQNCDLKEGVFTCRLRARFQGFESYQPVLESMEDIFHNLGLEMFRSSKAWNYVMSKCSLEDNHLDIMDWAVLYMQDLIRYSLFPEHIFGKFPYQKSIVNEWFKQGRDTEEEGYGEVNVLNRMIEKKQKQDEPYPMLDGKDFPRGIEEEGHQLFYHGTDHNAAVSILEDGIDLGAGKANKDFSHGKGFYLNNDFQEARKWAFRIRDRKRAVLIFKIPTEVLDEFRDASINLLDDEDEWQRITYHFRLDPNRRFRREMNQVSFIEGPIASVVVRGVVKIKGPIEGSYQMCLHSDKIAHQFDLNLHSIVFFD